MPSRVDDSLRHMLQSAEEIHLYVKDLTLERYRQDRRTSLAVERLLQILTEAAFRLGPLCVELCPEVDWRGIRGLGNFLRHEYDRIDDQAIWDVLQQQLPPLATALRRALARRQAQEERS